jgi:hypothetical protein
MIIVGMSIRLTTTYGGEAPICSGEMEVAGGLHPQLPP